ncbi:MAG: exosortase system-associated protein, TIGR04073 family [Candidatus Omnitrophota bacterium]|jgi:putative exosortase-associated protein (TIGR04073 family)
MRRERGIKRHQRCIRRKAGVKRFIRIFSPFVLIMLLALPGLAQQDPGEKLVQGVEDTLTGWTDLPQEIVETAQETNAVEGVTTGVIKGAGEAVIQTVEGVVETATFYSAESGNKE